MYSSELDKYFRGEIADLKAATVDLTSRILAVEKQETKAETQQNLLAIGELSAEDDVLTVRTPAPPTPRPRSPPFPALRAVNVACADEYILFELTHRLGQRRHPPGIR